MIVNEKSYTSKCDSLNLDKIGRKEIYDDKNQIINTLIKVNQTY